MENKQLRNSKKNGLFKLLILCYAVFGLFIFNSCAPIFASLDYEESVSESEDLDEKLDKRIIAQPDEVEEEPDEVEESDEVEEEPDEVEESDEVEEEPDEVDEDEEWPERVAFLTFDDGPGIYTHRLLDILYEKDVPAIFFVKGESILNTLPYSEVSMARMLEEGHYVGLHTMTHQYYTLYVGEGAPGRFVAEKLELQQLIYDLTGHYTYLCRAAYGMMTGFRPGHHVAVEEAGINCIDWNIDPKDWRNDATRINEKVVEQVELLNFPPELVIVLHEYEQTVQALPQIIAYLREQGYVFKTYEPGYEFIYYQYQQ